MLPVQFSSLSKLTQSEQVAWGKTKIEGSRQVQHCSMRNQEKSEEDE